MSRVVVIKVVIDGAGGPRDRTVLGWMDAIGGWHCERHPRGRTCPCRQLLADHLAAHPPAPRAGGGAGQSPRPPSTDPGVEAACTHTGEAPR